MDEGQWKIENIKLKKKSIVYRPSSIFYAFGAAVSTFTSTFTIFFASEVVAGGFCGRDLPNEPLNILPRFVRLSPLPMIIRIF